MSLGYHSQRSPQATAGLPEGPPAGRGRSLDDSIPGTSTYAKPEDDYTPNSPPEGSIYRKDSPRDLAKPQDDGDDTIDHSRAQPSYMGLGPRDPDDYSKTKYPYRDDIPDVMKSARFVVQLVLLDQARTATLRGIAGRVAATYMQILSGVNPKIVTRSSEVKVKLKRADIKNLRWIFSAESNANNLYAVKVKAIRPKKGMTAMAKMDLEVSCSCPAWQWQGPEFHAAGGYQLGQVRGTAGTPDIRDPERQNKVCKHVVAVLDNIKSWKLPA